MSCFSCGGNARSRLIKYKQEYAENGISRYFYKLKTDGMIFTCKASSFNIILETHIKPNFINGAEYSHISEFNG